MKWSLLSCALAIAAGTAVAAQAQSFSEQTISTDRPGMLFGTSIVPAGHLQIESGMLTFQNSEIPGGDSSLLSTPTFLRYGLSDLFELQMGVSPYNSLTMRSFGRSESFSGPGDIQLGAKYALMAGGAGIPSITLVGFVTVPSGDGAISGGRPAYNIDAVAAWQFADDSALSTMIGYTQTPISGDQYADSGALAASVSHSINDRLGFYVEAGCFPGFHHAADTAVAGGGITYLLTNHLQIDGFFDVGLNHASPNSLAGTGISFLL
ncbi:MAG: transporter [Rhodanobacteraceae bacterium]